MQPATDPALRVINIIEPMWPMLTERARGVFERIESHTTSNVATVTTFGALYPRPKTEEEKFANYRDFAHRLNYVIEHFDGRGHNVVIESSIFTSHARVDTSFSCPLEVPIVKERIALVAFLWLYDPVDIMPYGEARKAWVNSIVGEQLRCMVEGEIPQNPPGLFTPPDLTAEEFDSMMREALLKVAGGELRDRMQEESGS